MIEIRLREVMKAYRQRTGEYLTYKKLAQRTGMGESTLRAMASPHAYNTTLRTIDTLCHALQCTLAELLDFHWNTGASQPPEGSIENPTVSIADMSGRNSPDTFPASEWILQTEAARLHGVRRQSISALVQAGRLATRVIDGRTFVRRTDVLALPPPRRPGRRKAPDKSEP